MKLQTASVTTLAITRQQTHQQFRLNAVMRSLSTRLIRVALALTVAFWMAGAGCMLGCEGMVASAKSEAATPTGSVPVIVSGEACASKPGHDCCAKRGLKRTAAQAEVSANPQSAISAITINLSGTSSPMMDCPLAVNATAVLSKAKQDQSSAALLLARTDSSIPSLHEQATALSPPFRLPNRGHTYLRCCVFLI